MNLTAEERFDVALSLALGIPISHLKLRLTNREYQLYQKYYMTMSFGEEAEYVRSAQQIITIISQVSGAMGSKKQIKLKVDDIYPQLSLEKTANGNNAVDWSNASEQLRIELVEAGLYTEEGIPTGKGKNTI